MTKLSPEQEFCVLCARLVLSPDVSVRIQSLVTGSFDWKEAMSRALEVGIAPLVYKHISSSALQQNIPSEILGFLEKEYHRNTLRNLRIYGQLREILEATQKLQVPLILLKGSFLARFLYDDFALRPMSDLDMLCKEFDSGCMGEILRVLGYHQENIFRSPYHEKIATLETSHLPTFVRKNSFGVEVHCWLFSANGSKIPDMEKLWEQSEQVDFEGYNVRILSTEEQLLHLCHHLYLHIDGYRTVSLYWFCDIDEWIRRAGDDLDWNMFYDMADSIGISCQVESVLHIVKKHWDTPVPERINVGEKKSYSSFTIEDIFRKRKENYLRKCIQNIWKQWRYLGFFGGICLLWRYFFPCEEYLVHVYKLADRRSVKKYYIIHPFTIMKRITESLLAAAGFSLLKGRNQGA